MLDVNLGPSYSAFTPAQLPTGTLSRFLPHAVAVGIGYVTYRKTKKVGLSVLAGLGGVVVIVGAALLTGNIGVRQ